MVNYKYYIKGVEVFPLNRDNIKLVYEPQSDGDIVFEKKLNSALIFKYTESFDFKAQEVSDPTEELALKIKRLCNGKYNDFVELYFTMAEGEFDDDNCVFSVSAKTKKDFPKDVPVNIIIQQNRIQDSSGLPYNDGVFAGSEQYKQAFYFDKTILSVAQESNSKIKGIKSDFFQINPDVVSTDCLPGVVNKWTKLAFSALSDVQYPLPTNPATVEEITFTELMKDLNILFDVFWFIDDDFNLRIEHRSFFEGLVGFDITSTTYKKYLKGKNKYKYEIKETPRVFKVSTAGSPQYAQLKFGYYGRINKNESAVDLKTTKIRTDYATIRYYGGSSAEDGLFLFACEVSGSAYTMLDSPTVDEGTLFNNYEQVFNQNLYLTPFILLSRLHTYGRSDDMALFESNTVWEDTAASGVLERGQIRAGGFVSQSTKEIKAQEVISIPNCCDNQVDIETKIQTPLGKAKVKRAEFELDTQMINLELMYKKEKTNFTPKSLTGLRSWYRGDYGIVTTGAPNYFVTLWRDSSGNGVDLISSAGTEPTTLGATHGIFIGQGVASPVNTNTFMQSASAIQLFPNKRGEIFILYEILFSATVPSEQVSLISNTAAPFFNISFANGLLYSTEYTPTTYPQNFYSNSGLLRVSRIADDKMFAQHNSMKVPEYQYIDPSTNAITFTDELINPKTIPNTQPSNSKIKIGFNSGLSTGNIGQAIVKEIIIYDRVLTEEEAEKVELYIASRGYYSITAKTPYHF